MATTSFLPGDRVKVNNNVECGFPCDKCRGKKGAVISIDPEIIRVKMDDPIDCSIVENAKNDQIIALYPEELDMVTPRIGPPASRIKTDKFQRLIP